MPLKCAWERQQIRTGPNRFRQKSFRARLRSPGSYPRHSGKRGSRSLRALLPRSPWSRSREAAVHKAYQSFEDNRRAWRIKDLEKVEANGEESSFLFGDLNGNWWEITSARA